MNNPNTRYILDSFDISPSDSEEVKARKRSIVLKIRQSLAAKEEFQEPWYTGSVDFANAEAEFYSMAGEYQEAALNILENKDNGTPEVLTVDDGEYATRLEFPEDDRESMLKALERGIDYAVEDTLDFPALTLRIPEPTNTTVLGTETMSLNQILQSQNINVDQGTLLLYKTVMNGHFLDLPLNRVRGILTYDSNTPLIFNFYRNAIVVSPGSGNKNVYYFNRFWDFDKIKQKFVLILSGQARNLIGFSLLPEEKITEFLIKDIII